MTSIQTLDDTAREILRANDRGGYTVPTDGLYPYQWNWDSVFSAFGWATFDPARAWAELDLLIAGQWDNGMIPHILFHKPDPGYFPGPDVWGCDGPIASSGITQPPIAATFLRKLWAQAPDVDTDRLARHVAALTRWHRWFMDWRSNEGAICVTHPWESGRDNAPDWDGAMAALEPGDVGPYTRRDTGHVDPSMRPTKEDYDRYVWLVQRGRRMGWDDATMAKDPPFMVADPTMTFTLLRACRDLSALAAITGQDSAEIDGWIDRLEGGAATLWNPDLGGYDARDAVRGGFAHSLSNASFLCWYAGIDARGMEAHFDRVMDAVPHGVPSYDPQGPKFEPRRYWRGPTWGMMNTLIGLGLADCGHHARSERLRATTAKLIETHGFAEYFDPITGDPAGGQRFSWTAAIWLGWASPTAAEVPA